MISLKIETKGVQAWLKEMQVKAKNLKPVMSTLVQAAKDDQTDHFKGQASPHGKWAPLSKWTRRIPKQKQYRASSLVKGRKSVTYGKTGQRLGVSKYIRLKPGTRMLGRLNNATTAKVYTDGNLVVRSRVAFSGVHQKGAKVGKGAVVPAREFIWFSQKFLDRAVATVGQFMVKEQRR